MDFDDVIRIIPLLVFILCMILLCVFFISSQQNIDKDELCGKCGYSKATDVKYLLPVSMFPIVEKLECDKSHIITLTYPEIVDKFGDKSKDWNKPGVHCR